MTQGIALPLTPQQQALWVEYQRCPYNTAYNTCLQFKLEGCLDVERFRIAVTQAVHFFEALRGVFTQTAGTPYWCIQPTCDITLNEIVLSQSPTESDEIRQQALSLLDKGVNEVISLTEFPIIRGTLIQSSQQDFYFLGLVPHIISDGYSARWLLEALSLLYNEGPAALAQVFGQMPKLSQYHLNQPEIDLASKAYWQDRLKDAPRAVRWGWTPVRQDMQGQRLTFCFSEALSSDLKQLAKQGRTTLFQVMAALWALFLGRMTHTNAITMGYPINVRPRGQQRLFGFFVNILPLCLSWSGQDTFMDLVRQGTQQRKKDKPHQHFPAYDIVRAMREISPDSDGVLFNTALTQTVDRQQRFTFDGVNAYALPVPQQAMQNDLACLFEETPTHIYGIFEYCLAYFDASLMQAWAEAFEALALQVVAHPDQPLAQIKPHVCAPKAAVSSLPEQTSILDDIRAAGTAALMYQDKYYDWATLWSHADAIVRALQSKAIQPGQAVGIDMTPHAGLIPALLAIWRVGAYYVALDPALPAARLQTMFDDTQAQIVLSNQPDVFQGFVKSCLSFDGIAGPAPVCAPVSPDACAYVLYTSGSTGQPNGVPITHADIAARLAGMQSVHAIDADDVVLCNTALSFDVSVSEIWWGLWRGAKLILVDTTTHYSPSALVSCMQTHAVTVAGFVPTVIRQLLTCWSDMPHLKLCMACGEMLPLDTQQQFLAAQPKTTLVNYYGPTEATVFATYDICSGDDAYYSIGRALPGVALRVAAPDSQACPIGVVGELYIGGVGLTQGYLNRSILNGERFYQDEHNQRWYRTGDMARLMPDGRYAFLGRRDRQVKIRGQRVELNDIEAQLMRRGGVQGLAVHLSKTPPFQDKLIAYIVGEVDVDEAAWRAYAKAHLSSIMQPHYWMAIKALPRTGSQKVDYKALPLPRLESTGTTDENNTLESQLRDIWSDVLQRPRDTIGVEDDFFALGGDSLAMMQVLAQLESQGLTIDMQDLFEVKNIASLVHRVKPLAARQIDAPIQGVYPVLARQQQFFDAAFSQSAYWNHIFYLRSREPLDKTMIEKAVNIVRTHHDGLRAVFEQDEGHWQGHINARSEGTVCQYHTLTALSARKQEAAIAQICHDSQLAGNLESGPLFQVLVFERSAQSADIVVWAHHLLLDMVSIRIVLEDFLRAYLQIKQGLSPNLPAKTTDVLSWSEYCQQQVHSSAVQSEVPRWIAQASKPCPTLPMKKRAHNVEAQKTSRFVVLDAVTSEQLLYDAPQACQTPLPIILYHALYRAFQSVCAQDNLAVNICRHARDVKNSDINLHRTAGWINCVFPLYLQDIPADLMQGLQAVHQAYDSLPGGGLNYGMLKYITKQLKDCPQPQIFFNYVGHFDLSVPRSSPFEIMMPPKALAASHADNHLEYVCYFEAIIYQKELITRLSYAESVLPKRFVNKLLKAYEKALRETADYAASGVIFNKCSAPPTTLA